MPDSASPHRLAGYNYPASLPETEMSAGRVLAASRRKLILNKIESLLQNHALLRLYLAVGKRIKVPTLRKHAIQADGVTLNACIYNIHSVLTSAVFTLKLHSPSLLRGVPTFPLLELRVALLYHP